METRVERGQAKEDRVTGAIERRTAMAPSSLFLGTCTRLNGRIGFFEIIGQEQLGALRGPVGRSIPHHGELQQNGEAARIGRDRSRGGGIVNGPGRLCSHSSSQSFTHSNQKQ